MIQITIVKLTPEWWLKPSMGALCIAGAESINSEDEDSDECGKPHAGI